ncbi:Ig-like domain-containing protein [Cohnella sp. 56]|uniref:Ig-like domain-containing protein n=1 Tax=Cohnella sp. 56 TaxID=3113722 RepID=UPI0030E8EBDD
MKKQWALYVAGAALLMATAPTHGYAATANGPKANASFKDLTGLSEPVKEAIDEAVDKGLLQGDMLGNFRPNASLTRQELAVIIQRALDLPLDESTKRYKDVDPDGWAAKAITAVSSAGIMQGDGKGRFMPKGLLTRQEMAALLLRAAGVQPEGNAVENPGLSDWAAVSNWAKPYVSESVRLNNIKVTGGKFEPSATVKRQEVAGMLLNNFYPVARTSTLSDVGEGQARVNGIRYRLSADAAALIKPENAAVLKNAAITVETEGDMITRVTSLTLRASGQPAASNEKEFSGNLMLDGGGATVEGDVAVEADYISIRDLKVKKNFTIGKQLENDFYGLDLQVDGRTNVLGGDSNTVVFENSTLPTVDINKSDVRVEATGTTKIEQMNVMSNATIVGSMTADVSQVYVTGNATQIEVQGNLGNLTLSGSQPMTIVGNAVIGTLAVQTSAPVLLNNSGTVNRLEVNVSSAQVTATPSLNVNSVILGSGVPASTVTGATTSPPVNTAPYIVTELPGTLLQLADGSTTINLVPYFRDDEQTKLHYTVASTPATTVKAAVDANGLLTLTPLKSGTSRIVIAVDDGLGKKVTTTFTATVNTAPVASELADQRKALTTGDLVLDLSQWFTDAERDPISYQAESDNEAIAAIVLTGDQLTVTPLQVGSTPITITADDGRGGKSTRTFVMTVDPVPNQAPTLTESVMTNQNLLIGANAYTLDVGEYFADPEQQPLTYAAESSDPAVAKVAMNGSQLSVQALKVGSTVVKVTAIDVHDAAVSASFTVTVPNRLPQAGIAPAGAQAYVGKADYTLDVSELFSDADGQPLTYEVESGSPSIATAALAGPQLSVHALAVGSTELTVTATDDQGGTESLKFVVEVPNQKPSEIAPQTDLTMTKGDEQIVDPAAVFADPEGQPLTYTVAVSDPAIASATIEAGQVKIIALAPGDIKVELTAKDSLGAENTSKFNVKVVNRKPVASSQPQDMTLHLGDGDQELDPADYFSDPDGQSLVYTAQSSNAGVAAVTTSNGRVVIHVVGIGTANVTLTATDPLNASEQASFTVDVPNRAPYAAHPPANRTLTVGGADVVLDLSGVFEDDDGQALTFEATDSDETVAVSHVSGSMLTIHALSQGASTVTLRAKDSMGATATAALEVTIQAKPPNQPPKVDTAPSDQSIAIGSSDYKLNLATVFSDPDGDTLTYTAVAQNSTIATAAVSGSQLTVHALSPGATKVTLTATDGAGASQSASFTVTVTGVQNNRPEVVAVIPEQVLTGGVTNTRSFDLSQLFEDPDGDAMTFSAVGSVPGAVTVSVSDGMISLSAGASAGVSTITITADDGKGGTGQYSLVVRNAPLMAGGRLTVTINQPIDLAAYFPGENVFKMYAGTADSTFIGPTTLNGTTWAPVDRLFWTWIIGADGKAIVVVAKA